MTRQVRRHYAIHGATHDVEIAEEKDRLRVRIDGRDANDAARLVRAFPGGADLVVTHAGGRSRAVVLREGNTVHVAMAGRVWRLGVVSARQEGEVAAVASIETFVGSPMTGVVRQVAAAVGACYAAGDTLVVVEAMKMEFAVEAPRAVTVAEVRVKAGDRVEIGQVLVTFAEGGA